MPFAGLVSNAFAVPRAAAGVGQSPEEKRQAAIAALIARGAGPFSRSSMPPPAAGPSGYTGANLTNGTPNPNAAAAAMPGLFSKPAEAPQAAAPLGAGVAGVAGAMPGLFSKPAEAPQAAAPGGGWFGGVASTVGRGRMDVNAPSGASAALMSYDEAKAKYGAARAKQMQAEGKVGR